MRLSRPTQDENIKYWAKGAKRWDEQLPEVHLGSSGTTALSEGPEIVSGGFHFLLFVLKSGSVGQIDKLPNPRTFNVCYLMCYWRPKTLSCAIHAKRNLNIYSGTHKNSKETTTPTCDGLAPCQCVQHRQTSNKQLRQVNKS